MHCRATGADPGQMRTLVDLLKLDGLIEARDWSEDKGPAFVPTTFGQEVLHTPELLDKLRKGDPLRPEDPGSVIRQRLWQPVKAYVTPALVVVNILVFVWCLQSAGGASPPLFSLNVPGAWGEKLQELGGATGADLVRGEWWRLITCCFLHFNLLHIGMNMYTLWGSGKDVEGSWTWWRFALIYSIAGWGGSCLAMALRPVSVLVGASGAICGVLGAEAAWVWLYGRYLPRDMASRARSQIFTTFLIMGVISLHPMVSWEGHLGGAVTGAVAAIVLHYQRFGRGAIRWLAIPLLALVPLLSWGHLQHARQTSSAWEKLERRQPGARPGDPFPGEDFYERFQKPTDDRINDLFALCEGPVGKLRDIHPTRRDAKRVKRVVQDLERARERLQEVAQEVEATELREQQEKQAKETTLKVLSCAVTLAESAKAFLQADTDESDARYKACVRDFKKLEAESNNWSTEMDKLRAKTKKE